MKYNIYSAFGRTGSIRLLKILSKKVSILATLGKPEVCAGESLHLSEHIDKESGRMVLKRDNGPSLELLLPKKETFYCPPTKEINTYEFPELFYELENEYAVLHSHVCTWGVNDEWTNVLSTRKNMSELPMSFKIAQRTGFWASENRDDIHESENSWYSEHPFYFPVSQYISILENINQRQQLFLEGVKRDTGKDAIITYLEESYDDLEIKFDIKIQKEWREDLDKGVSKRRPKDYVVNYDELIDAYNQYEYKGIEREN